MSISTSVNQSSDVPLRPRERRTWLYVCVLGFALVAAAGWIAHEFNGQIIAGFHLWQIFVLAAILSFSGLMSGLSGFGFSAVGALCLILLPPKLGVPLLMALSTANQLMSLGQLKEDMPKSWREAWPAGSGPYVIGGIIGVPLGTWLLNHVPAPKLMLLFGSILTVYSIYSLFKPASLKAPGKSSAGSGVAVGFIGGTIGGFTAFPGAAVVVWTGLKDLPKRLTRSIVQPYILVLQLVSLTTNAISHPEVFGHRFWVLLAIMIPVVLPGTLGGVALYRRISDVNFRRISFFLLGLSGVGLLIKVLLK
jgi:uncharacterized membrane protein YfcA